MEEKKNITPVELCEFSHKNQELVTSIIHFSN